MNISGKPIFPNREIIRTPLLTSAVSNAAQAEVFCGNLFPKVIFPKPLLRWGRTWKPA